MPSTRRLFLKHSGILLAGAWLTGKSASAVAERLAKHFAAEDFGTLYAQFIDQRTVIDSDKLNLILPEIAEDGAVVPVSIASELDGIEKLYLFADKNPTPLLAEFELTPLIATFLTARIKLAESCSVILLAEHNGELLRTSRWVNVMRGGCGTG
ncbi:thiosulfate oxidation carrier protein SoxY [Methylomonas rosea]|uniref:Thiosulfate oxidation carrier protein SoxY n=1 Tax=Methylomonas rosea TaxID=2952227 RepID=A0ABT1TUL0_9GAMM|nr:thiosulfate oxidation carrier protein SoxY [Methylomonas sp. WSC-7]MCQ8118468.1 thiosulfate oxidation carrier protein SoxY [Methylomonas sp. WSC-7]